LIWRYLARWRCRQLDRQLADPTRTQERVLARALAEIRGCRLANDLGLTGREDVQAFRRRAPITDYRFYEPYIDEVIAGGRSIMFRGAPARIAQTGGTTGKPKQLPLNRALIRSYRQFNLDMVFRYMVESGEDQILDDRIMAVAANPAADHTCTGAPIGFITGIMADIAPGPVQRRYVPSIDVIRNPDMAEKIRLTCHQCYEARGRVRAALGLTPYLMTTWTHILDHAEEREGRRSAIADLFPELRVAFHGGTTFDLYRQRMERLSGPGIDHRNVYSAAEGPIAAQHSGDSPGLTPTLSGIFLEFIPEAQADEKDPETRLLSEVEVGETYYLVMTTQGGLLRYRIGDRVRFIESDPPRFVVLGKTGDQIDLSAEKIGVDLASAVLAEAGETCGVCVLDFLVCPAHGSLENKQPAHEWIVEVETRPDLASFRREVEERLCRHNPMYRELRERDFSLGPPRFTFVPSGTFQSYQESAFHFGQQKMMHMHNDRELAEALLKHSPSG